MEQNSQKQPIGQASSLIELAKLHPNLIINVRLGDLIDANKELLDEAKRVLVETLNPFNTNDYITEKEVMKIFNRGTTTLYNWRVTGYLIPVKVGKSNLYLKSEVEQKFKERHVKR